MVLGVQDILDKLQPTLLGQLDIHLQDLGILQLQEATHLQVLVTLLLQADTLDSLRMVEVSLEF